MLVRMKIAVSGTRNGADWPAPGETLELPSEEAVALIGAGIAAPAEAAATTAPRRRSSRLEAATEEAPERAARTSRPRGRRA